MPRYMGVSVDASTVRMMPSTSEGEASSSPFSALSFAAGVFAFSSLALLADDFAGFGTAALLGTLVSFAASSLVFLVSLLMRVSSTSSPLRFLCCAITFLLVAIAALRAGTFSFAVDSFVAVIATRPLWIAPLAFLPVAFELCRVLK